MAFQMMNESDDANTSRNWSIGMYNFLLITL